MGLRVTDEAETVGLDRAEHAEAGYNMVDVGSAARTS
jgi:ammonia channel protein AmtB